MFRNLFLLILCLCLSTHLSAQLESSVKTIPNPVTAFGGCVEDAGTSTQMLTTASQSIDVNFLCFGDALMVTHNGNGEVNSGDPDPGTTPGIDYVAFSCPPTVNGSTAASIVADPCVLLGGGGDPIVNGNGMANGNSTILNSGSYQTLVNGGAGGPPVEVWFATTTVDEYDGTFGSILTENAGQPGECLNINIADAFSVVFLNAITLSNQSVSGTMGMVDVNGGLPEWDASNYAGVNIYLQTNPTDVATVTSGPISHGGTITFELPTDLAGNPIFGTYVIEVTDNTNCQNQPFTMLFTPVLNAVIAAQDSLLCNGDVTDVDITVSGGTAPYTFTFSDGANSGNGSVANNGQTAVIPNLGAGNYNFTVTDGVGDMITLPFQLLEPPVLFISAIGENVSCFGDSDGFAYINNVGGGVGNYVYTWSNMQSGPNVDTIFNLPPGGFDVTVTDGNGCVEDASGAIGQPTGITFLTGAVDASCSGSFDGEASVVNPAGGTVAVDYTYTWSSVPPQFTQVATGLDVGKYYITVSDDNGCMRVDSVTVGSTTIILTNPAITDVDCFGGSDGLIALSPSGTGALPLTYTWSPNAGAGPNDAIASVLSADTYFVTVTDLNGCNVRDSFIVNAPDSINISIQNIMDAQCGGEASGSVTVMASGGSAPLGNYSYDWGNAQFSATLANVIAGDYTVTVTDDLGCQNDLTITINEPDSLLADAFVLDSINCAGETGTISVTSTGGDGNNTYMWSGGLDPVQSPTNVGTNAYTVTVTDGAGCTAVDAVVLLSPPPFSVSISVVNNGCFGEASGTVVATPSGGQSPIVSYLWSTGVTNDSLVNIPAGSYTITITDSGGCTAVDDVILNPLQMVPTVVFQDSTTCYNGTDGGAEVTSVFGGNAPYTYEWPSGEFGQIATNLLQGVQTVTITDGNGCMVTDNVNILGPPPFIYNYNGAVEITQPSCFGDIDGSITVTPIGGTGAYTYVWSGFPAAGATLSNIGAGSYGLVISDANACIADGPQNIIVNQPDPLAIDSLASANTLCAGESTGSIQVFDVSGGTPSYTYTWSDPLSQNTSQAINLAPGNYTVTVTDKNGCTTTSGGMVEEPTPIFGDVRVIDARCFGEFSGSILVDTTFGGTGTYKYSSDGDFFYDFPVFNGLRSGTYVLYIKDQNDCLFTDTVFIDQPDPIVVEVEGAPEIEIQMGDSVRLNGLWEPSYLDSIIWTPNSALSCDTCANPMASPLSTTTYLLTVRDTIGCFGQAEITVDVDRNRNIFIPNIFTPNGDTENDVFTVFGGVGVERIESMRIFDRWGEMLFFQENFMPNDPAFGWDGRFNGTRLPPGVFVYYIEVLFVDGTRIPYKGDVTLIK